MPVFQQQYEAESSLKAIELELDEIRTDLRCNRLGAMSHSRRSVLRRYQCKSRDQYFNDDTTGMPLQGLHHQGHWLKFARCVKLGDRGGVSKQS